MFDGGTLLITGGTGSFGDAVLRRCLNSSIKEIRIFSRDEKKQEDMRKKYSNPKIKFYLGDVRNRDSIDIAMRGVNYCFHAAALKQVPSCEFYPMEAVYTNVLGTSNVISSAVNHNIDRLICLSTDKAVYPINAMGISKAMMEKIMVATSRTLNDRGTIISATRYGNVMGSRGSVIPLFVNQILSNRPLSITDPNMTRFMMSLDDAVDLVFYAFKNGSNGDIFVQKAPAATIEIVAKALLTIFNRLDLGTSVIGARHGEKLFESLLSREERSAAIDLGDYFRIPADSRDLNYGAYEVSGEIEKLRFEEYNSHNTKRLDLSEMVSLLSQADFIGKSVQESL